MRDSKKRRRSTLYSHIEIIWLVTIRSTPGVPVGMVLPSDRHIKYRFLELSSSPLRLQLCKSASSTSVLGPWLFQDKERCYGPNRKHLLRFLALSNCYRLTNYSELSIKWVSRTASKFSKVLMGNGKWDLCWNLSSHSFVMISRVYVALLMLGS